MNILNLLTKDQLNNIEELKVSKDTILFNEDSMCNSICIIKKGKIKISSYLSNGNEIIYTSLKDNDIFGNNLIFSTTPYYKGNVICIEDTIIYKIDKEYLITLLQNNQDFLIEYLKISSNNTKKLNDQIKLLSFDSSLDKLMYYLYINDNDITYNSISELASTLFIRRETLSRLITKLVNEKEIVHYKKRITKLKK